MTSAIAASRAFADFGAAGAAAIAGTAAGCAAGTGAGAGAACCLGRVGSAMPGWISPVTPGRLTGWAGCAAGTAIATGCAAG